MPGVASEANAIEGMRIGEWTSGKVVLECYKQISESDWG